MRYPVGGGNALLARRMRDVRLKTAAGDTSLYEQKAAESWAGRVDAVIVRTDQVDVTGLLLRPDGHVVWVGEEVAGASTALWTWFGASDHR